MGRWVEDRNRRLLRARDAIDRDYAKPLDVPALARVAYVSEAHFSRTFRSTFGETPHQYLQRRRVERAMALLRNTDRSVTEICLDVGFTSLGTFSRTFRAVTGYSPTSYRCASTPVHVPTCFTKAWTRPVGERVIPGYTCSMKTAISIPDETFTQAERRAAALGMSRSEFFTRAAQRYLEQLDSESLAAEIDAAVELAGGDDSAAVAVAAAHRRLAEADW